MKLINFACAMSFAALCLGANSRAATIQVAFGGLRANPNTSPTTVVSGTEALGGALTGGRFYWVCLDSTQDAPANQTVSYDVSTNGSILQAGNFGSSGYNAAARTAITQAATNMYYAFESQMQSAPGTSYASAYQRAVWAVTFGYLVWGLSGPLTTGGIESIIDNYESYILDEPLIEDYLRAALTTPSGAGTVYYANPTSDPDLQAVLLFPVAVPEPSTLTLTGMLGFFFITRRRRN